MPSSGTNAPTPKPDQDPAKDGMHDVDQAAQEKAAEEREESGGYD